MATDCLPMYTLGNRNRYGSDQAGAVAYGRDGHAGPHGALSGDPQTIVDGTAGVGNNTAAWDPAISVNVPDAAVGGTYTATLTPSVA